VTNQENDRDWAKRKLKHKMIKQAVVIILSIVTGVAGGIAAADVPDDDDFECVYDD
jgi:hypothetical protein